MQNGRREENEPEREKVMNEKKEDKNYLQLNVTNCKRREFRGVKDYRKGKIQVLQAINIISRYITLIATHASGSTNEI